MFGGSKYLSQTSSMSSGDRMIFNEAIRVITARVRTYDGRLCFHRCVSVQGGSQVKVQVGGGAQVQVGRGGPRSRSRSRSGGPRSRWGGTQSQI